MKTIIDKGSIIGTGQDAALNLAILGHRILGLSRESDQSKKVREEIEAQTEKEN